MFTNLCNFANNTTFNAREKDLNPLVNRLEYGNYPTNKWFENNYKELNPGLFIYLFGQKLGSKKLRKQETETISCRN